MDELAANLFEREGVSSVSCDRIDDSSDSEATYEYPSVKECKKELKNSARYFKRKLRDMKKKEKSIDFYWYLGEKAESVYLEDFETLSDIKDKLVEIGFNEIFANDSIIGEYRDLEFFNHQGVGSCLLVEWYYI